MSASTVTENRLHLISRWITMIVLIHLQAEIPDCQAAVISPFGSDSTAEVIEGKTNNVYTCSGLTNGVDSYWRIHAPGFSPPGSPPGSPSAAATCKAGTSPGPCSGGDLGSAFTGYRLSGTQTTLNIDDTLVNNKDLLTQGTLQCGEKESTLVSCLMDYIVPATGNCSVQTGTTNADRYQVSGQCSLNSGATSSRGRFRCEWHIKPQASTLLINVTLTSENYRTNCQLANRVLPSVSGQYTYSVIIIPGNTQISAGIITVSRPPAPSPAQTSCTPTGFVTVNTQVTCSCTVTSLGLPQGRLKWVKVKDSSDINYGNYGALTLQMSTQTLTLNDHNITLFRCDVDWIENLSGSPTYTASIGVPPSQVTMMLNSNLGNNTAVEGKVVTFRCETSDGRPTANATLYNHDNQTQMTEGLSPLTYTVTVRCEDGGQYYCTADNAMGPTVTGVNTQLIVLCPPRGVPTLPSVNFTGDPVSVSFNVTASPVPHQVTFAYLGSLKDNVTATTQAVSVIGAEIAGKCVSTNSAYVSRCTVTVKNVTSKTAEGLYQIIVNNTQGQARFEMQLLYSGYQPTTGPAQAESSSKTGIIVGVIVGILGLIVIIIVCIFIWRRLHHQTTNKHVPCSPAKLDMHPLQDVNPGGSVPTKRVKTKGKKPSKPLRQNPQAENVYSNVDGKTDHAGLNYVAVEFTTTTSGPPVKPKPKEPDVIYSDIDISKTDST